MDVVNSHQDGDTANINLPAAPAGLRLLVLVVHKAICVDACMSYAWACLSYCRRQDAASCSVIPAYGLRIGICRLVLHLLQALQSCPALLCRMLFEVFGCIFLVRLLL